MLRFGDKWLDFNGGLGLDKFTALTLLGEKQGASFEHAKKAFRRQAMRWHPDRNSEKGAEDKFKQARAAFEWLESLHASGDWASAKHTIHADAKTNNGTSAAAKHGKSDELNAEEPEIRKSWDPKDGPIFKVGNPKDKPKLIAEIFFQSFMEIVAGYAGKGVGPRLAGRIAGMGFNGFMAFREWDISEVGMLKMAFLRSFWANPVSGAFDILEQARNYCLDLGWSTQVIEAINPCCEIHSAGTDVFYIFDAASSSLPINPSGAQLGFYQDWKRCMLGLFSGFAANERALRFSLRVSGKSFGRLFLEAALEVSPKVAQAFVGLSTPKQFATKEDWLGLAIDAGMDPGVLLGWIQEEPIKLFCGRLDAMDAKQSKKFKSIAEQRMDMERQWMGAGSWASRRHRILGAAQTKWTRIDARLRPSGFGGIMRAIKIDSLSESENLTEKWIYDAKGNEVVLLATKGRKIKDGLSMFDGVPISILCVWRCMFSQGSAQDFMDAFELMEAYWGKRQLILKDSNGMSAVDWAELALKHAH